MNATIELDKPIVDIMKSLPDSGGLHSKVFEAEVRLRKNHADMWLDRVPWFNQYEHWRAVGLACIQRSLSISNDSLLNDLDLLSKFKPYEPEFEDTLI